MSLALNFRSRSRYPEGGYRGSHAKPGYGSYYNRAYGRGYYHATWLEIELPLLESIMAPLGGRGRTCMDFACGTGRVASVAAEHFGRVTGVDVSAEMLAEAETPGNVELLKIDLTRKPLERTFDVITAFRFFLNAEPELRRDALAAIHRHLATDGRLVCNGHMTPSSPAGLACRVSNRVPGLLHRNTLGLAQFAALLDAQGFAIERIVHYGYLPGPWGLPPRLAQALVRPVERIATAMGVPRFLAQNFLIVAKKKSSG
jgi:SAM-dependent methyltransferase